MSDGPTIPILKPADQITERDLNDWPQVEVLVPEENQDEKATPTALGERRRGQSFREFQGYPGSQEAPGE